MITGVAVREELARLHPAEAAPRLLGARLRAFGPAGEVMLRLTEVEAYAGAEDPGSHGHRGQTPRNATMFGEAARLYVYFNYGMHMCCNVVVGESGASAGVLLRGAEVTGGVELARLRRESFRGPAASRVPDLALARGPGNLGRALGADLADNGQDLATTHPRGVNEHGFELALLDEAEHRRLANDIRSSLRTGVSGAGGLDPFHWRYWLKGAGGVSPYRAHPSVRADRDA